jgi:hypothetical protein
VSQSEKNAEVASLPPPPPLLLLLLPLLLQLYHPGV